MTENLNLAEAQKEDQSSTPDLDTDWTVLNKSPSPEPSAEGAEGLLYPSLDDKKANEELPKVQVGPPRIQQQDPPKQQLPPKVQVALQAMENMGFNDQGGWLTTLLIKYDGDIGKVLDLLSPAKPFRA